MFKVDVKVDLSGVHRKIKTGKEKAQFALDTQVLKDSNYYIPKDRGTLETSSFYASKLGDGKLVWDTPYARRLYWNPQYNFSGDVNPNARGLWFEEAKSNKLSEWLKISEAFYS